MSTEEIKEYIGTQLKALTSIASPTGFTKNATDYLMKQLEAMGYAPQLSNKGNVSVEIGGVGAPLVLAAHVDTLGAMVRSIKDNGRLRPTTIGGHQWSTADGENCMVFTRDGRMYTGVVLNTEPSAHVADEKVETKEENMEILLDENVNDKQGVAALGIQTVDLISKRKIHTWLDAPSVQVSEVFRLWSARHKSYTKRDQTESILCLFRL